MSPCRAGAAARRARIERRTVGPVRPRRAGWISASDQLKRYGPSAASRAQQAWAASSAAGRNSNDTVGTALVSPCEHLQLRALDVDLDERRAAVLLDQRVERGGRDLERLIPRHAGKLRFLCPRLAPAARQRRHRRRAFADRQRGAAPVAGDRALDHADVGTASDQSSQDSERRVAAAPLPPRGSPAPRTRASDCPGARRCRRRGRPA